MICFIFQFINMLRETSSSQRHLEDYSSSSSSSCLQCELNKAFSDRIKLLNSLINLLILTPHIAGVTTQANVRVSSLIADRVLDHLAERV